MNRVEEIAAVFNNSATVLYKKWPFPKGMSGGSGGWQHCIYAVFCELRTAPPEAVKAMLETDWPPEMTGEEQVQAMFGAAIDAVLGEYAEAARSSGKG